MKKIIIIVAIILLTGCTKAEIKTDNQPSISDPRYLALLKEFQKNPSVEGFHSLCEELGRIEVPADIKSCQKASDDNFMFLMASDNTLLVEINDTDSDEVKTKKKNFNEDIQRLDDRIIYGYDKRQAADIVPFLEASLEETKMKGMYRGYHDFIPPFLNLCFPLDDVETIINNQ